ncbi:MAG: hypothetical protein LC769_00225 [Chloroflexi bacterium]|nr:hypothetical protein [Chloroflexota bacterium]
MMDEHEAQEAQGRPESAPPSEHDEHEAHEGAAEQSAHEEHGAHEEHETGLRHVFHERAIALRTMDRPLKLVTGLALAELLGSAALLAVRSLHIPLPAISVFVQEGHLYQMPLPVFVASLFFLALAWSYMLAGALHAHPLVRLGGLALFTWAMLEIRDVTQGPYQAAATVVLALLWAVGLATWIIDRRAIKAGAPERGHRHHLRMLTFCVVFLLVAALYAVAWISLNGLGAMLFPSAVSVQLDTLQFAIIPILFLAGTDFAEWGEVVGERLAEATGRVRPPRLLAAVTALVAIAILVNIAVQFHHEALHQLVLGLIALGLVGLLATRVRLHAALPERVPYAALAVAAIAVFAVILVQTPSIVFSTVNQAAARRAAQAHPGGALTPYRHDTRAPHFSIAYPAQWELQTIEDVGPKQPLILDFNGIHAANVAIMYVVASSATVEKTLARLRTEWFGVAYRGKVVQAKPAPAHGPWQVTSYTETARKGAQPLLRGYVWERREGKLFWLMMSMAPARFYTFYGATFQDMVDSWSPTLGPAGESTLAGDAPAAGTVTVGDRMSANEGFIALAIALLGGAALALGVRRVRSGPLAAATLFVVVGSLTLFFSELPTMRLVYGHALPLLPPGQHLHIPGYQAAVALASLLVLGLLVARRCLTARCSALLALIFGLNIALQVVAWIFDGYGRASDLSGRLSIAQGAIVLLALLWDVTMSGEEITNVEGRIFARHTRVLLFFGYVMLVATQVLYYSSLQVQATGAAAEAQFETRSTRRRPSPPRSLAARRPRPRWRSPLRRVSRRRGLSISWATRSPGRATVHSERLEGNNGWTDAYHHGESCGRGRRARRVRMRPHRSHSHDDGKRIRFFPGL